MKCRSWFVRTNCGSLSFLHCPLEVAARTSKDRRECFALPVRLHVHFQRVLYLQLWRWAVREPMIQSQFKKQGVIKYLKATHTLHCIALYCHALHYITFCYITLQYITLHCIRLHYNILPCIALHYIALHCIALHYIITYCIALHYIIIYHLSQCKINHFSLIYSW